MCIGSQTHAESALLKSRQRNTIHWVPAASEKAEHRRQNIDPRYWPEFPELHAHSAAGRKAEGDRGVSVNHLQLTKPTN